MKKLLLVALATFSMNSFADQCSWNDEAVADRARELVLQLADINGTTRPFVLSYCDHCAGMNATEAYPTYLSKSANVQAKNAVGIKRADDWMVKAAQVKAYGKTYEYWGLEVYDSQGQNVSQYGQLDLAYTYVKTAPGVFMNLAYATGCETLMEKEKAFIYITPAEWTSRIKSPSVKPFSVYFKPQYSSEENY